MERGKNGIARDAVHSGLIHAPGFIREAAKSKCTCLKNWHGQHAGPRTKKEQGSGPCSENCVDPLYPASSDLIFFGGLTLLFARQGSSRDLDHQASASVSLRPNW